MQTGAAARVLQSEATPSTRLTVPLSPVAIERIAGYVVVAKIGQGGMAQVHLAMASGPSNFRKLLVLKRLHGHLASEPDNVAMFLQEATLASRLSHPNIVQTFEVGKSGAQHYMAMEYLDGQPLDRVLARLRREQTTLPRELAVGIACELLEGLHHAHEARDYDGTPLGIVHRDVSPHNVFVTYDGQVKLLDFGIAKTTAHGEHTRFGTIKGKLAYIAPEQARSEVIDRRADLWSAGVTLWSCLTGQRLFRGANEVELLRSALRDDIPRLSDVLSDVPDELSEVLARVLQRDRTRRYASALELKRALSPFRRRSQPGDERTALSGVMRALFHDEIAARREVIAGCFAQVSALAEVAPSAAGEARDSITDYPASNTLHALQASSQPLRWSPRLKWLVTGSLAVLLGASASLLTHDAQPAPVAKPAAAAVRAPVAAPSEGAAREAQAPVTEPAASADGKVADTMPAVRKAPRGARPEPAAEQVSPKPALAVLEEQAAQPEVAAKGHLTLDSVPYAIVTLHGQRLGITPIDVDLPASSHQLELRNPELGLTATYQVTIRAGEAIQRRVALE